MNNKSIKKVFDNNVNVVLILLIEIHCGAMCGLARSTRLANPNHRHSFNLCATKESFLHGGQNKKINRKSFKIY